LSPTIIFTILASGMGRYTFRMANEIYLYIRCFILYVILFALPFTSLSQTNPVSSHYAVNSLLVNPSMVGAHNGLGFMAGYRYQWTGIPGAPQTTYFASDLALEQIKSGAGIQILYDKIGVYSLTGIQLAYAFRQPINEWVMSIGVNGGITLQGLDGSKLVAPHGDYSGGTPDHMDDILPTDKFKSIRPELGLGFAFILPGEAELGVSVQNIINSATKIEGIISSNNLTWGRSLHVYAGASFDAGTQFSIHPALSLRTDFNNFQADLSVLGGFRQIVYAGIGYRGYNKNSSGALIPMLSCKPVRNMQIMYSCDADISTLKKYSNGSHEISLKYLMPLKQLAKQPKIIYHPRFL
jgi:type IX secretion system PorP/SprF family membrane protein